MKSLVAFVLCAIVLGVAIHFQLSTEPAFMLGFIAGGMAVDYIPEIIWK